MKPTVKTQETTFFRPITGYNKAILVELKERSYMSKEGRNCTRTDAVFKFVGASDKAFEKICVTNDQNEADLGICNMIITSFGGKALNEGEDAEVVLNRCMNKECALLAYPQVSKQDGKAYMHTASFGRVAGNDAVKPISFVGTEIDIKEQGSKVPKTVVPKTEDDTPF